jgi:hypothetical protein
MFSCSHDRGKLNFHIWVCLFCKYLMKQTRYGNPRPIFGFSQLVPTLCCHMSVGTNSHIWYNVTKCYMYVTSVTKVLQRCHNSATKVSHIVVHRCHMHVTKASQIVLQAGHKTVTDSVTSMSQMVLQTSHNCHK